MHDKRFKRIAADLELNEVPDGYVIYDAAKDRVHFLNPIAALVFELCDGKHTMDEVRSLLMSGYDLTSFPDDDFQTAVDTMVSEGLIAQCQPSS